MIADGECPAAPDTELTRVVGKKHLWKLDARQVGPLQWKTIGTDKVSAYRCDYCGESMIEPIRWRNGR